MMKMREFSNTSKSATQEPDIGETILNQGVINILRVGQGRGGDGKIYSLEREKEKSNRGF